MSIRIHGGPRRMIVFLLVLSLVVGALLAGVGWLIAQPVRARPGAVTGSVPPERLRAHVEHLSQTTYPRSVSSPAMLREAGEYVFRELAAAGVQPEWQPFRVGPREFRNVRARIGAAGPVLVVGAHYDSFELTPGADDNASGVAGLIELARLLAARPPNHLQVELVAYTLEEPPYFRTPHMGSHHHAAGLVATGEPVLGAVVLEMIGYFSDAPGSQRLPMPLLRLYYPGRGDFITVAGRLGDRGFTRAVKRGMKGATGLPVRSINAPTFVPGIDFSDHRNYWPHGISAVMITDTAFYRNPHYHEPTDTADTLDYRRMAMVVKALDAMIRAQDAPL